MVNIIFGLVACLILAISISGIKNGFAFTGEILKATFQSIVELFTGKVQVEQLTGIVGISDMVIETNGFVDFVCMLSVISISLGVTNLLPFPQWPHIYPGWPDHTHTSAAYILLY